MNMPVALLICLFRLKVRSLTMKPVKSLNKPEIAMALGMLGRFVRSNFVDEDEESNEDSEKAQSEMDPTGVLSSQYSQPEEEMKEGQLTQTVITSCQIKRRERSANMSLLQKEDV